MTPPMPLATEPMVKRACGVRCEAPAARLFNQKISVFSWS